MTPPDKVNDALERIGAALERLAPAPRFAPRWNDADAFVWSAGDVQLETVKEVARVPLVLLRGIDRQRDILLENTRRFAQGLPANNALLWGARGMGKSALIKAVHATAQGEAADGLLLKLVEIHREDVGTLGHLLKLIEGAAVQVILFCGDLSFDAQDDAYRPLKAARRRNRRAPAQRSFLRHVEPASPRSSRDGRERALDCDPSERGDRGKSLAFRWLGFYACTQADYLAIVRGYAKHFGLQIAQADLERRALEWAMTRGSRSGCVAWQFIEDLGGELGQRLAFALSR